MSNQYTDGGMGFFFEASNKNNEDPGNQYSSFAPCAAGVQTKDFSKNLEGIYENFKNEHGVDMKRELHKHMDDAEFMESFKHAILDPIVEAYREVNAGDPHIENAIENVNTLWDNKVRLYNESSMMGSFLPATSMELPVLVKQFFTSVTKDIIDQEAVKTPTLVKHVRAQYLVDNNTGDEWEYPACMFNGDFQKVFDAGKGHPIDETIMVPLPAFRYDIISNLTAGISGVDKLSLALTINKIVVGGKPIVLKGNGIAVDLAANNAFINGNLEFTADDGTEVDDTISGRVNFLKGTIDLSCAAGTIDGVYFSGYLSNENNLRSTSVREEYRNMHFKIEDGCRWSMPFTIEQIEDAAALLDINYYNRMVDAITKGQEDQEAMSVITFLNKEYDKFINLSTDHNNLESYASSYTCDIQPPTSFAGDPFSYCAKAAHFRLKALVNQIINTTKLEGLSFVIVGNPLATSVLDEFVDWKSTSGTSIGGISVNNSYGFATGMGANVRVVSTNIYDAYTDDVQSETSQRELILHIYVYPTDKEHISYRQLKYTSHIFNSEGQTAYQSPQAQGGGAYKVLTATSRYKTIAIQGIQAKLILLNSAYIYGFVPTVRTAIDGSPWTALPVATAPST